MKPLTASSLSAQPDVDVGGYMQTWGLYNYDEGVDNGSDTWGWRLRRARLTAQSELTDNLSTSTWLEFAGSDNILLDFHLDYDFSSSASVRVGQFRPHGQSYITGVQGSAGLLFAERATIASFNSGQTGFNAFRDIGVMMYGRTGRLYYAVHATNGHGRFTQAGADISSRSFGSGSYGGRVDYDLTDNWLVGGHLSMNRQRDVVLGAVGPYDIDRYSGSLRLAADELGSSAIYSESEFIIGSRDDTEAFTYDGLYSRLGYRLQSDLHLLTRFDYMTERSDNGGEDEVQYGYTFGINRFFTRNDQELGRIILNYSLTQTPAEDWVHGITAVFQVRFIP